MPPELVKKSASELERELLASPTWEHRKEECQLGPFNPDGSEVKPEKYKNVYNKKLMNM